MKIELQVGMLHWQRPISICTTNKMHRQTDTYWPSSRMHQEIIEAPNSNQIIFSCTLQPFHALSFQSMFSINSFHIEWDMIIVTVFLSMMNQMEFHLVQNWKENCHHDHIPFNVEGKNIRIYTIVLRGLRRVINWSPSCRETLVSRISDVVFSSLEKEYRNKMLCNFSA